MIQLTVNGKSSQFDGDPEMPLLWYLRDELQLTGTKFGCGMGLCGACTVHLNGEAVRSCLTPMKRRRRQDHHHHRRPRAATATIRCRKRGRRCNVPQCGYCQSGQIMQAAALLKKKPKPTDHDIDEAMQGNICRCGTYQRIRAGHQDGRGGESMIERHRCFSRRGFLGRFSPPERWCSARRSACPAMAATSGDAKTWQPNVYLGIEPDGTVMIVAHRSEMGTGMRTLCP